MKATIQHLGFQEKQTSVSCYWVKAPTFGFHWHYHPELEITYVYKGRGVRLVGDNVAQFQAGDFILLGSNLPHTWISDDAHKDSGQQMEVVVLQFSPHLFTDTLDGLPECQAIYQLIQNTKRGLSFSETHKATAINMLMEMIGGEGLSQLQRLLSFLQVLAEDPQTNYLASTKYAPSLNEETEERLLKVCGYIHNHFTEPISLDYMASLACMNPTAFCRFFKKMTGQTMIEYITDLKIGKACHLLITKPHYSIAQITLATGFNSQTLFNRTFKKYKGMSPSSFRKQFVRS